MVRINLLPWRELQRRRKKRNLVEAAAAAVALLLLVGLGSHLQLDSMINAQQARNELLEQEIARLTVRLRKIQQLQETKADLLARMGVIQQLQASRAEVVHLFDELVASIPDGVFLTSIDQRGNQIEVEGRAQSNARVSALMRNINASTWISHAELLVIENKDQTGTGLSHFRLSFKQRRFAPQADNAGSVGRLQAAPAATG